MGNGTKVFCVNCVHHYLSISQGIQCVNPEFTSISYATGERTPVNWDHEDRNRLGYCKGYEKNKTTTGVRDVSKED